MPGKTPESLGALPQFDKNAQLEDRSIKSLNALLRTANDFCLRDERASDFGVDASLEVICDGLATNFRSQVQLKAVHTLAPNKDGSFSLPVDVHNVNYLLNGTSPLYVLYLDDHDEFLYAWAADERRRFDAETPGWKEQETVSVRFRERLDAQSLRAVRDRILQEEMLRRKLRDVLAVRSNCEHVRVAIDPATLSTRDGDAAYEELCNAGLTIVANGLAAQAEALIGLLDVARRSEPRIQLIAAYAQFSRGRFQSASGHLAEAMLRVDELATDDRETLNELRDVCDFQTGRITYEVFLRRQAEGAANSSKTGRLGRRLASVRFAQLGERDRALRPKRLEELRDVVNEILNDVEQSDGMKMQARIFLAFGEGHDWIQRILLQMGLIGIRRQLKQTWAQPDSAGLVSEVEGFERWAAGLVTLTEEAKKLSIPLLYAEALRTAVVVRTAFMGVLRFRELFMGAGVGPDHAALNALKRDAEAAVAIFARADHLEGQLRAKLGLADICELLEDLTGAKRVAAEVLPIAEAMGLVDLVERARSFLEDRSHLQEFERSIAARRSIDEDYVTATMSEEDLDSFAELARTASNLPVSRLPVIRRDVAAIRAIAVERLHWCRHIIQIQSLFHQRMQITSYSVDPERFCRCEKHRYESLQGNTDAPAVIAHFKQVYCADCPDRQPKAAV